MLLPLLEKYAGERIKSFAYGLDPTGSLSSSMGTEKIHENKGLTKYHALGGVIGGGVIAPSIIMGTMRGIGAAPKGLRAAAVAGAKGLIEPFRQIHEGIKTSQKLKSAIHSGKNLEREEIKKMKGLDLLSIGDVKQLGTEVQKGKTGSIFDRLMGSDKDQSGNLQKLRSSVNANIIAGVGGLGVGGIFGGVGAGLGYKRGQQALAKGQQK